MMAEETPLLAVALASSRARRLTAVKAVFTGEYSGIRGALLIVMDIDTTRLERLYAVIAGEGDETRYAVSQGWKDFEAVVINAKLQGRIAHQTTGEVTGYLRRVLSEDFAGTLCDALKLDSPHDAKRILSDLVSRAIADTEILMEIAIETAEDIGAAPPEEMPAPAPGVSADAGASVSAKEVKIRVDPILSPVTGIPAKEIKPGMKLRLQIRDFATVRQHLGKMLLIKEGGIDKGVVTGQVISIAPTEHDRVSIATNIAEGVVGVANISGELRVQVMDRSARLDPSISASGTVVPPPPVLSSIMFLWASIGIFTFLLILAYLVFGGII